MLYLVWRVESVGIRYPRWICGTPYPLCGSHGEALWQRWLCNDKVVFVMMCWGDHLEVLIQRSRALISPGVCMTLTHAIFIMVLLSDYILFWFVISSFVSFQNLFEWKGEFSNTISSMETELLCHYRSCGKGHMTKVDMLYKEDTDVHWILGILRSTKI